MKHKHAEMIKAKADNVDLVVFVKRESKEWRKIYHSNGNELPAFYESFEYFLCHPKHAEVCLHWLNGGEVESVDEWGVNVLVSKSEFGDWRKNSAFMDNTLDLRIKPRKEKRWIGIYDRRFVTQPPVGTLQEVQELVLSSSEYKNCAPEGWQFIEIEVEV